MTRNRSCIQGLPYVPGVARGVLRAGAAAGAPDSIAMLSPPDWQLPASLPVGLVVVDAAPFSHKMIRLRMSGLPIVLIDTEQAQQLLEGVEVIIDGASGFISDELDISVTAPPAPPEPGQPLTMADGEVVHLHASVLDSASARAAVLAGAEAIGLVRSEALVPPGERIPDKTFYQTAFADLCQAAAPLPLTLRLLDIAPDKTPAWLPSIAAPGGALGLQGARLFAIEPVRSVLHAQLAALDELSERYALQLLIPYLVRHEELSYWSRYIEQRLTKPVAIGAMVETPVGALDVHNWFDTAAFVAVGCNDLMQCLFAADRDRPELRSYLDPYAPPLFRFFREMIEGAVTHLERILLCGLLSQLPGVLPVLIGLGFRTFSVDAPLIPYLAQTVRTLTVADAKVLSREVCEARDSQQVMSLVGLDVKVH